MYFNNNTYIIYQINLSLVEKLHTYFGNVDAGRGVHEPRFKTILNYKTIIFAPLYTTIICTSLALLCSSSSTKCVVEVIPLPPSTSSPSAALTGGCFSSWLLGLEAVASGSVA
ncbi:hypothetical protein ABZP36_028465 [Zizania latifolia]